MGEPSAGTERKEWGRVDRGEGETALRASPPEGASELGMRACNRKGRMLTREQGGHSDGQQSEKLGTKCN